VGPVVMEPIQVPHVLAEPICLRSASMSINMKSDGIGDTAGPVTWNQSRYSTYWRSPYVWAPPVCPST